VATDALLMDGAAGNAGTVACDAIRAGCDILCYPTDLEATVAALTGATDPVLSARIAESLTRYDAAVAWVNGKGEELAEGFTPEGVADLLLSRGLRRGTPVRGGAPVAIEIVDDDQGGRWPASPSTYLADALREAKALVEEQADADGDADASARGNAGSAGPHAHPHPHTHPSFKVLMALAEPRASKGRGGFSAENRARLAHLAPKADLIVLFGHPRLCKEIPGDRPILFAWHRQKLMQEAVARWLLRLA